MPRSPLRRAGRAVLCLLVVAGTLGLGAPASADTTDQRVQALLARVAVLQAQTRQALAGYQQALDSVSAAVSTDITSQQQSQASAAAARRARDRLQGRVRALYMTGGPAGMLSSVLDGDLTDVGGRVVAVRRVVDSTRNDAVTARATAQDAAATAAADHARTGASISTARDIMAAATRLSGLLAQQQTLLARARNDQAAARARAALLAAQRAAAAVTTGATRSTGPLPASAAYLQLYHQAAATCPGLDWAVLAAVGQVESGHGRNVSTSSAGAQGPMQFLPATFAAYAVDGDHDGRTDIMDPADAIFTAAHYLCVQGAGQGPAGLHDALFHYNHAEWYVQLVLSIAQNYR